MKSSFHLLFIEKPTKTIFYFFTITFINSTCAAQESNVLGFRYSPAFYKASGALVIYTGKYADTSDQDDLSTILGTKMHTDKRTFEYILHYVQTKPYLEKDIDEKISGYCIYAAKNKKFTLHAFLPEDKWDTFFVSLSREIEENKLDSVA